jgi:hypothetical protein
MNGTIKDSRVGIINAVTSPLGFLVLAFLAGETAITVYVAHMGGDFSSVFWVMLLCMVLLIVTVVSLAILRPEALFGMRPLSSHYAVLFCAKLTRALDGPLSDLNGVAEEEAWQILAEVTGSPETLKMDKPYIEFCESVSSGLKQHGDLKARYGKARGMIRSVPPAQAPVPTPPAAPPAPAV